MESAEKPLESDLRGFIQTIDELVDAEKNDTEKRQEEPRSMER